MSYQLYLMKKLKKKRLNSRQEKNRKKKTLQTRKDWSIHELDVLHKGLQKYPAGVPNRWELIAELVKRPLKEVMAKAKELAGKVQAKGEINLDHSAFDRYKATVAKKVETANQKLEDSKYGTEMSTNFELQDNKEETTPPTPKITSTPVTSDGATAMSSLPNTKNPPTPTITDWTSEQQKALELGLKTIPAGADRWDKIALLVPGSSKKDCVDRYNFLVAQVKAKKK